MTTLDIADYKTVDWNVSKSIVDASWTLSAQIDKHTAPAFSTKIKAVAQDHGGNDRTPFVGIFPGSDYTMTPAANKAGLVGYDYAWYLTTQYVPAADRTTLIGTDPAETVTTLLGGAVNWATVTGVKPFRMIADVNWATIKKVFEFDEKCTRWQAIMEVAEYCNYVFVVKPYYDSGDWYSYAYFIPEADIDNASPTGLDLPAMQTFMKPDAYLMSGTTIRDNPEKGYNRIKVTGYDEATQTYYYSTDGAANTYETAGVTAGTELAIEYFYASKDLDSQAKVTARATALLNYFQASSKLYIARLKQRLDLELYQKVRFADYDKIEGTTGVPVDMRITRISYHHAAVDDYVEIEFAKDQDAQQLKRLTEAVNPDYVSGTLDIIDDDLYATGLIEPLGNTYLRTDKAASGDQELYTDLDVMEDHAIEFYESTSGNLWGYLRAFDGVGYGGLILESLSAQNLHVRAAGDLKLYAAADIFFEDLNNAEISLSSIIAGAGLWEVDGSETQLSTADDIDMQGHDIKELNQLFGKVESGFTWDLIFYGSNVGGSAAVEMMRWDASAQDIKIATGVDLNMAGNDIDMSWSGKIKSLAAATASGDAVRYNEYSVHTHDSRYYTETEINTWRAGTTVTEMGYVHGVTSDIQTQLNARMLLSVYDPGSDDVVIPTAGGTGIASYAQGDILYASATNILAKLAKGTASQVLTMNAGATLPEWAAPSNDSLWEDMGSYVRLIVADDVDFRARNILHLASLRSEFAAGMTIFDSNGATKGYLGTTSYALSAAADINMAGNDIDMSWSGKIKSLAAATASGDAVRYNEYSVHTHAIYLPLAGGTMSGGIDMAGYFMDNVFTVQASGINGIVLQDSGGTIRAHLAHYSDSCHHFSWPIDMNSQKITDLAAGTVNGDAVRYNEFHAHDVWEVSGIYIRPLLGRPVTMEGEEITKLPEIWGPLNSDFSLHGSNAADTSWVEFLKWDHETETIVIGGDAIFHEDAYIYQDAANRGRVWVHEPVADERYFTIEGVSVNGVLIRDNSVAVAYFADDEIDLKVKTSITADLWLNANDLRQIEYAEFYPGSVPTVPVAGGGGKGFVYYDSTSNKLKVCTSVSPVTWETITSA